MTNRIPSLNGVLTHETDAPVKPSRRKVVKAETVKTTRASRPSAFCQRIAYAVGGCGVGVLGLSVVHCTESISLLTGSHWALSGLLAIGIDAGMVTCEIAGLAAHGTTVEKKVCPWASRYVAVAVLLSMLLNAYAFGLHAPQGMAWAAWCLGVVLPALVWMLGRVAGELWLGRTKNG